MDSQVKTKTLVPVIGQGSSMGKGYLVMESFAGHAHSFALLTCYTAPELNPSVWHVSLDDLFRSALNMFYGEEGSKARDAPHFSNPNMNKGSEVGDEHFREAGVHVGNGEPEAINVTYRMAVLFL